MAYQRKTQDVWEVQQYTGSQYKWEHVTTELRFKDAKERAKEYRTNQPEYPVRIVLRREKIS